MGKRREIVWEVAATFFRRAAEGPAVGPSEEEGAHTLAQEHRAGSCRNGMPPYGTSRVERNK